MVMGERGMADMTEMEMPLPENTIPMMTGDGPYGSVEMGGMFSILKVRKNQPHNDYKNTGWFKQAPGTQAYEWKGKQPVINRSQSAGSSAMNRVHEQPDVEVKSKSLLEIQNIIIRRKKYVYKNSVYYRNTHTNPIDICSWGSA